MSAAFQLRVVGSFPLLEKEGRPRHQKRRREATFVRSGRGGQFGEIFRLQTFRRTDHPVWRRFGGFANSYYWRSHPSFSRRGKFKRPRYPASEYRPCIAPATSATASGLWAI